jgi:hypothetical protein
VLGPAPSPGRLGDPPPTRGLGQQPADLDQQVVGDGVDGELGPDLEEILDPDGVVGELRVGLEALDVHAVPVEPVHEQRRHGLAHVAVTIGVPPSAVARRDGGFVATVKS